MTSLRYIFFYNKCKSFILFFYFCFEIIIFFDTLNMKMKCNKRFYQITNKEPLIKMVIMLKVIRMAKSGTKLSEGDTLTNFPSILIFILYCTFINVLKLYRWDKKWFVSCKIKHFLQRFCQRFSHTLKQVILFHLFRLYLNINFPR